VKVTTHLHLVPRSKNAWSYTSTPPYIFMARCLVKHRDNFPTYIFMARCLVKHRDNFPTYIFVTRCLVKHRGNFPTYIFVTRCLVKHRDNFPTYIFTAGCLVKHRDNFLYRLPLPYPLLYSSASLFLSSVTKTPHLPSLSMFGVVN
jgi:hypothetical protein